MHKPVGARFGNNQSQHMADLARRHHAQRNGGAYQPGEALRSAWASSHDDDVAGSGWSPSPGGEQRPGLREAEPSAPRRSVQPSRRNCFAVYGVARGVDLRREPDQVTKMDLLVLSFRVNEFGGQGNLIRQTPVELRGASISGGLREGDQVGLEGRWHDGVVRTNAVTIYRDGQVVGLVRSTRRVAAWQIIVSVLMVAAFIAFVIFAWSKVNDAAGPPGPWGADNPDVPFNPNPADEPQPQTADDLLTAEAIEIAESATTVRAP
jgi:hypothetical protein